MTPSRDDRNNQQNPQCDNSSLSNVSFNEPYGLGEFAFWEGTAFIMTSTAPGKFGLPDDVDPRVMSRPEFAGLAPVTVFPGVLSHLDLAYAGPVGFRPLTLDLHLPHRTVKSPAPVVVYAHRGGFLLGSKRMGPWRFLLDAGIAVASVSYRLSGESVFPGAVHDVAAAVRWMRSRASDYGLDAESIVGFGSTAGAYLIQKAIGIAVIFLAAMTLWDYAYMPCPCMGKRPPKFKGA